MMMAFLTEVERFSLYQQKEKKEKKGSVERQCFPPLYSFFCDVENLFILLLLLILHGMFLNLVKENEIVFSFVWLVLLFLSLLDFSSHDKVKISILFLILTSLPTL